MAGRYTSPVFSAFLSQNCALHLDFWRGLEVYCMQRFSRRTIGNKLNPLIRFGGLPLITGGLLKTTYNAPSRLLVQNRDVLNIADAAGTFLPPLSVPCSRLMTISTAVIPAGLPGPLGGGKGSPPQAAGSTLPVTQTQSAPPVF